MTDPTLKDYLIVEPPESDELPEMIQRASECNDPHVFRILDAMIAHRKRRHLRTSDNGSPHRAAVHATGPADPPGEIGHDPRPAA